MKVIDFEQKGNVVRLYYGTNKNNEYHGSAWSIPPYEHNAGMVKQQYVKGSVDIAFNTMYVVLSPETDYHYNDHSPFSKNDFKNRKAPCIIVKKLEQSDEWVYYSELMGDKTALQIYFNDDINIVKDKCVKYGGNIIK